VRNYKGDVVSDHVPFVIIRWISNSLGNLGGYLLRRQAQQFLKGGRVVHRQIGQHLTVQFDSRQFQAVHELAVGSPSVPASGIDTQDPQAAEFAFALPAVPIGVGPGM